MQITKISENQLEIILNMEDLKNNKISLHSFMCHSIQSQDLCFDILNLINKEINFSVKNYDIVIESFAIPIKSSFILFITRVPKPTYLHASKVKYGRFTAQKSFWLKFDTFENFCMFCTFLNTNLIIDSYLYLLDKHYYLYIKLNKIKYFSKLLIMASEFASNTYNSNYTLDENADSIIKTNAIETCKKYFI